MKKNFYINRDNHFKTLKTFGLIGSTSLILIICLYNLTSMLSDFVIIPTVLGGAFLISLFSFYRTLFLLKLPLLKVDNNTIEYFNVLWYNKYYWKKFDIASFNTEKLILSIGLNNGKILDQFHLSSITSADINEVLQIFTENNKIKRTLS